MANGDTEQKLKAGMGKRPSTVQVLQTPVPADGLGAWLWGVPVLGAIALTALGAQLSPLVNRELSAFVNRDGGMIDAVEMVVVISGVFYLALTVRGNRRILKTHIETEDQALLSLYRKVEHMEAEMLSLSIPLSKLADVLEKQEATRTAEKKALEESGEIEPAHLTPVLDRIFGVMDRLDKKLGKGNSE